MDGLYVAAFLNIGAGDFDVGLRGGGLRGGHFAITQRAFRLDHYEYVPGVFRIAEGEEDRARVRIESRIGNLFNAVEYVDSGGSRAAALGGLLR